MQDKKCNKCNEVKQIDAFSIKRASKDGRMSICKICDSAKATKWYYDNLEKSKLRAKTYREEHRKIMLKKDLDRYYCNKEAELKKRKEYYDKNKESIILKVSNYQKENREVNRMAQRKHYKNNKAKHMAWNATRRAMKMRATPPWLSDIHNMQIKWFYAAAEMMSNTSGVKHHVDHIHPLQGNGFNGLHVPWNLRIIPAKENLSKANKLPHDMQHLSWEV